MANIQSAKKRIRQTEKRTAHNRIYRASARTYIRKVRQHLADGNIEEAEAEAVSAYSTLDRAARKRVLHPRNAARRKGRIMAALTAARRAAEKDS